MKHPTIKNKEQGKREEKKGKREERRGGEGTGEKGVERRGKEGRGQERRGEEGKRGREGREKREKGRGGKRKEMKGSEDHLPLPTHPLSTAKWSPPFLLLWNPPLHQCCGLSFHPFFCKKKSPLGKIHRQL
jgi:hypothetical protein